MKWLAIKYQDDEFLFVQSRQERENQNSALIDAGQVIETRVIKTFKTEDEAKKYCKEINSINGLIDRI